MGKGAVLKAGSDPTGCKMRRTHIPQSGYADSGSSLGVRSVATPGDLLVQLGEEKLHAALVPAEQSTPDRSQASRKSK